jgi:hypothetical protein
VYILIRHVSSCWLKFLYVSMIQITHKLSSIPKAYNFWSRDVIDARAFCHASIPTCILVPVCLLVCKFLLYTTNLSSLLHS